jgi:nitrogen fixation-related uncharacterized protein
MSVKGQIFSTDFLIACSIFIVAVGVLFIYWRYASSQIEETRNLNDMNEKLYLASQVLFTEGVPKYWSSENVVQLGLENNHMFNQTKMNSLSLLDYSKVLTLVGSENYYVYYRLHDENNSTLFEFGVYPSDARNVMKAERIGILNQSIAIVEVLLWR